MKQRLLFAAIAASVMIGCTPEESVISPNGNSESTIPVSIAYASGGAISDSSHRAIAIVTRRDGSKDTANLAITDEGINGRVKSSNLNDTVKVAVELHRRDGSLEYKGVDIVTRTGKEFSTVQSDLFRVEKAKDGSFSEESSGEILINREGSAQKLDQERVRAYLTLLLDQIELDESTREILVQMIVAREWTTRDLYLVESFAKLLIESQNNGDDEVIWDRDTVKIGEDGTIIDPVIDSNFISIEQIRGMVEVVAREYKISVELLAERVKMTGIVYNQLWPIQSKEKLYAVIIEEAKRIINGDNDSTVTDTVLTGCFTESQLKELALAEAKANNVSGEKLLGWLKENGFFKTQFNYGQKDEVYGWIKKGIYTIIANGDSTGVIEPVYTIIPVVEIEYAAERMALESKVSAVLLVKNLRVKSTLFSQDWYSNQWDEVRLIIKKEINQILYGSDQNDSVWIQPILSSEDITTMALTMAKSANVNGEELLSYLRLATPLFRETWSYEQKAKVEWIIKDAIATQFTNGDNTIDNDITDPYTGKDSISVIDTSSTDSGWSNGSEGDLIYRK